MINNIIGKRLLVMDRTALAACAVKRAKELGLYVIVANFYKTKDSPSKQVADEAIDIDISNIDAMLELIEEKKIDGIFVGWTDSHLPFYAEICKRAGLPCCGTVEQFGFLSNDKLKFKEYCIRHGVSVPKLYHLSMAFSDLDLKKIEYPVIVKPSDESGGRGIRKCNNEQELKENYTWLYNRSKSKNIFVEECIDSEYEVFFNYTIQEGYPSLSASFVVNKAMGLSDRKSTTILHIYPSSYIKSYRKDTEPQVIKMLKDLGLKNGILSLQGFVVDGKLKLFEAGYRMGGGQFYVFADKLNGINALDMMIEFSVTGYMTCGIAKDQDSPVFSRNCCNYYIPLKPGKIKQISGIDEIKGMQQVLQVLCFKSVGEVIEDTDALDNVIYRIHVMDISPEALAKTLVTISRTICVIDETGENMQLEPLTYERTLEMIRKA